MMFGIYETAWHWNPINKVIAGGGMGSAYKFERSGVLPMPIAGKIGRTQQRSVRKYKNRTANRPIVTNRERGEDCKLGLTAQTLKG